MNEETQQTRTQHEEAADAAALNETLAAENTDLRNRIARIALERSLEKAGARSPELLSRASEVKLELSDNGEITGLAEIIADLKRSMPEQFVVETATGGIDGGAGTREPANALTREMLEQMPATRIAELDWETVKRVLAGN